MSQLDGLSDPEELPEDIIVWAPRRGPLVGRLNAISVLAASLGALALFGLAAGAYLAGRRARIS
ncbi:MAG TPA: hypothetical protein VF122_04575 [Caulobacteraceae bacterium]